MTAHDVISHDDLTVLTAWMAREGYDAEALAEAVRKPWNYRHEIELSQAAFAEYREGVK